jgi:hypothetical protein
MKSYQVHICYILLAVFMQSAAQDVRVNASLEKSNLLIGEQTQLRLEADFPLGLQIQFPVLKDTIRKGIEIISEGKTDTLNGKDSTRIKLRKILTITSFDTGYSAIPPFVFSYGQNKKTSTEALLLGVHSVAVDTTRAFKDIRGVRTAPIPWWDYLRYLLYALPLLAGYLLYRYFKKKTPVAEVIQKQEVPTDPYLEAIEALEKLKAENLWQQGFHKEYHTRISEVLKIFISRAFQLHVLEHTSDETLVLFARIEKAQIPLGLLRQVLLLSDMVKFAKQVPIGGENDLSMQNAVGFIEYYVAIKKQEKNEVAAG